MTVSTASVRNSGLARTGIAGLVIAACWLLPVTVSWRFAPDLGHAWAVPLLIGYLLWERWNEFAAALPSRDPAPLAPGSRARRLLWVLAVGLACVQPPLRVFLAPFPQWPALLGLYTLTFLSVALAGAWMLGGRAGLRWIGGPLVLLVSALPVPSSFEGAVIIPLRELWAALTAEISNLLGLPALAIGTSVRLGAGWVGVDEACGGIRSLQACVMIGLFFGEWYRFRLLRRLALLAVAVAAALLGNFGRVLFLSLRASSGLHAVESSHDLAGWIAMGFSLVLTGWLACRWAGYRFPEQARTVAPAPAAATAAPISLAAVWLSFIAAIFAASDVGTRLWFARGESQRRAGVAQWTVALPEKHWSFRRTPLVESARDMLRPDNYVAGVWRAESNVQVAAYYIEWRRGQIARSVPFLHNPTVCLPLAGCELQGALEPLDIDWPGGAIRFFAYKFRRGSEDILVAFTIWDPSRGGPLTSPGDLSTWREWWRAQWREVREARQHQPAQLLTVTVPWSGAAAPIARDVLQKIVHPVSPP